MEDYADLLKNVEEMVKQNTYLKEENTRLYEEWHKMCSLLNQIEYSLKPPGKPCPPGVSPMDFYFRKVGPTGATPTQCSR
jgi:hypothetical protein